jgi:hypothetical protein
MALDFSLSTAGEKSGLTVALCINIVATVAIL